ncbi:MAG TPA: HAD domain-containing protein, partial [Rhabdochlamydiaceae bacterium]|nr:HAD domain-containing protein [Rhabdochlamydiaceae bacterium]
MSSELKRPLSVIFLDIDGVLMNWQPLDHVRARIERKAFELFGAGYYTDLQWKTAGSYCFVESAVENLVMLIEEVKKETEVAIVLTSTWRLDRTVDEITNQMFSSRPFSHFIIDKIADDDALRKKRGEEELSPIALAKYGFSLENRGSQIDYWLRENQLKLNIKNFV